MRKFFLTVIFTIAAILTLHAEETLKIKNDVVSVAGYKNTMITLEGDAQLKLFSESVSDVLQNSAINIKGESAWVCFENISRETLIGSGILESIKYNGKKISDGGNVNLLNYYGGVYIRPVPSIKHIPVVLNNKKSVALNEIYTDNDIPVGDNQLITIYLKRGNMIVAAENSDGTGARKVCMAIDHDCEIQLDSNLVGKVSFLRVTPWSYVSKRGLGGIGNKDSVTNKLLGAQWYYNWGIKNESTPTLDYAPMFWGRWGVDANIDTVGNKNLTNHILAFNEPDNQGESNFNAVEAATLYAPMLRAGLRLGSPGCREGVWKTWLSTFMDECKKREFSVDFICIHWYDWGNWSSTKNPTPDVDKLVARFKADIDACYKKYGLPIWITEFNANTNRLHQIHSEFLEKAITMLEAHPAVERYAYFQPFSGNGNYFEEVELTAVGKAYSEVKSTPAVLDSNPIPVSVIKNRK